MSSQVGSSAGHRGNNHLPTNASFRLSGGAANPGGPDAEESGASAGEQAKTQRDTRAEGARVEDNHKK